MVSVIGPGPRWLLVCDERMRRQRLRDQAAVTSRVAETRAREKTRKINALRMQMRFGRFAPEASVLGSVAGALAIGMSP
jgi:hypothetical protein